MADMALLKMAEDIMRSGAKTLKETGWFRDPQGMPSDWRGAIAKPAWKYEISDTPSKLIMDPRDFDKQRLSTVGDILSHPELFEAYPGLVKLPVEANPQINYRGHYSPSRNMIATRTGMEPDLFHSTLLHEIQHGIQGHENFVPGGSPMEEFGAAGAEVKKAVLGSIYQNWLRKNNMEDKGNATDLFYKEFGLGQNDIPSGWWGYSFGKTPEALQERALEIKNQYKGTLDPYEAYRRIHGENEAYNVEKRHELGITPEQTRDVDPESTAQWNFDQTFQAAQGRI